MDDSSSSWNEALRTFIETSNDPLKNIQQVEHTRPCGWGNTMTNVLAGLAAYPHPPYKPFLNLLKNEINLLIHLE